MKQKKKKKKQKNQKKKPVLHNSSKTSSLWALLKNLQTKVQNLFVGSFPIVMENKKKKTNRNKPDMKKKKLIKGLIPKKKQKNKQTNKTNKNRKAM
jgi:hypothetical protein